MIDTFKEDSHRSQLLPCPYCGMTTNDLCGVEYGRNHVTSWFFVQCVNCSVRMEQDRMDKVIGMWNTRISNEK